MDLRAQIDPNTVILRHLSISLSSIYRSPRQNISKETSELLHTLDQMEILDVYGIFYTTNKQHTFFSAVQGIFSKIDHILGYKASLKKFKNTEITPYIISDHNEIKLDFNNKRNHRKYSNT
jgi:exonuclease III